MDLWQNAAEKAETIELIEAYGEACEEYGKACMDGHEPWIRDSKSGRDYAKQRLLDFLSDETLVSNETPESERSAAHKQAELVEDEKDYEDFWNNDMKGRP